MFYVYHLIDPRDGRPFYVGKGTGSRISHHEAEARKGARNAKCSLIREIWKDGHEVRRQVVSEHEDENEALQAEFDEIAAIGLDALTNVLPGGKLGQRVYMERLAKAQDRKAAKEALFWERSFADLAPKFAHFLRCKSLGHDYGAWANGRWIDFSEALLAFFRDVVGVVGPAKAKEIMARHGVEVIA